MEYKQLGRTGLRVSPVVLGTVNFSSHANEADSFAMMDRALELGINHFDTANNYNAGRSEALMGPLVRAGRGASRQGRACHQGVLQAQRVGRYGHRSNGSQ